MLLLGKYGKMTFDGVAINPGDVDMEEFMMANLSLNVEFEDDLTIEDLLNFFSPLRPFIYSYTSEHYDTLKALITMKKVNKKYKCAKVFKKLIVEDGKIYFITCFDFVEDSEEVYEFLSQVPVVMDNNISIINEEGISNIEGDYTSDITLQEVIDAMFDDLVDTIKEGLI